MLQIWIGLYLASVWIDYWVMDSRNIAWARLYWHVGWLLNTGLALYTFSRLALPLIAIFFTAELVWARNIHDVHGLLFRLNRLSHVHWVFIEWRSWMLNTRMVRFKGMSLRLSRYITSWNERGSVTTFSSGWHPLWRTSCPFIAVSFGWFKSLHLSRSCSSIFKNLLSTLIVYCIFCWLSKLAVVWAWNITLTWWILLIIEFLLAVAIASCSTKSRCSATLSRIAFRVVIWSSNTSILFWRLLLLSFHLVRLTW